MADVGGHAIHMAHYLFGKPEKLSSVLAYNNEYARSNNVENFNAYQQSIMDQLHDATEYMNSVKL